MCWLSGCPGRSRRVWDLFSNNPCKQLSLERSKTLVRLFSFPPVFLRDTLLQQAAFASGTDLSYCTSTVVAASLVILNQSATILRHIVEAVWRLNVFLTFWITNAVHILKMWGDPKHHHKPLWQRNEWMNGWRSMWKKWAFKVWFVSRNRSYFDSFWWSRNIRKCCDQASLSTWSCLLVPLLGMLIICDMTVVGSGEERHSHWFNHVRFPLNDHNPGLTSPA